MNDQNAAQIRNMLSCEAHNDVLKTEAIARFEGRADDTQGLYSDIEALQAFQIPASLR